MDIILHSTKSLMGGYEKLFPTKKHIWFPNAYDDRYFKNLGMEKSKDLTFIGNICNRRQLLQDMKKKHRMNCYNITGIEMIEMVNKTKVNFNKSIAEDVNYRNFETLGCGTCLLTNYLEELEDLGFIDGVNCYLYKDDLDEKVELALNNWEKVGFMGEEFAKKHTYYERIKSLINDLEIAGILIK